MAQVYMSYEAEQELLAATLAQFPGEFGLRAFPGEVFRVSKVHSYVSNGEVMLYTTVKREGRWEAWCKGTPAELRRNMVPLD